MPVSMDEFVRLVEEVAPPELAYDWDNSGLLLRCGDTVHSVMIALDATLSVADEAQRAGCDMLLVHHPLIFSPVRRLNCHNSTDAVLMKLIRSGISMYAAHTTYDRALGGVNEGLASKLGLCNTEVIPGEGESLMRVGMLPEPLGTTEFLKRVKKGLGVEFVRVSQSESSGNISRVAVVGGSGSDFVMAAKNAGAQALITGEAKHHHFIQAAAIGLLLVEAGHFHTEYAFVNHIYMSLQSRLNEVQLDLVLKRAENDKAPYACR